MSGWIQGIEVGTRSLLTRELAMFGGPARTPAAPPCDLPTAAMPPVLGTGVTALSADRLRDTFVDFQYRRENTSLGEWRAQSRTLGQIELAFARLRDSAAGGLLTGFWNSWLQLARQPSATSRLAVSQEARLMVDRLHAAAGQLHSLEHTLNREIEMQVSRLNEMASRLALQNEQAARVAPGTQAAGGLRDSRDLILDELSRLAQATVEHTPTGAVNVRIGGVPLVSGHDGHEVRAVPSARAPRSGVEVVWAGSGDPVPVTGGELHATLTARNAWVPESREALDRLAQTLVNEINRLHGQGYTSDGRTGVALFDPRYVTADAIQLHPLVADNPERNIVAGRTTALRDVEVAQALAGLAEAPVLPDGRTTLNGYFNSVIAAVGMRSMEAQERTETQTLLVEQLDNHRRSLPGASMEEELGRMIRFQHAYEAAARVISAMDATLSTVVNGMGPAGR